MPFPLFVGDVTIYGQPLETSSRRKGQAGSAVKRKGSVIEANSKEINGTKKDGSDKANRVEPTTLEKLQPEEKVSSRKRLSTYSLEKKSPDKIISPAKSRNLAEDSSPLSPSRGTRHGGKVYLQDIEEKADVSSSLLAQHFAILRELSQYCSLLKENIGVDPEAMNLEDAWRNFNHLVELLEAGCDFLHYPIKL